MTPDRSSSGTSPEILQDINLQDDNSLLKIKNLVIKNRL